MYTKSAFISYFGYTIRNVFLNVLLNNHKECCPIISLKIHLLSLLLHTLFSSFFSICCSFLNLVRKETMAKQLFPNKVVFSANNSCSTRRNNENTDACSKFNGAAKKARPKSFFMYTKKNTRWCCALMLRPRPLQPLLETFQAYPSYTSCLKEKVKLIMKVSEWNSSCTKVNELVAGLLIISSFSNFCSTQTKWGIISNVQ